MSVNSIKQGILEYSSRQIYEERGGYNEILRYTAMEPIEKLAEGDYGLATTIAKQAVERKWKGKKVWSTYGAKFSEKQAYVLAKAIYDNKLLKNDKYNWIFKIPTPIEHRKKIKVKPTKASLRNK